MREKRHIAPLCYLTDFHGGKEQLRLFLAAGISWVQYRDKVSSRRDLYHNAITMRAITQEFGAFFIVNDHADIAAAVAADGVHLGQDDLPIDAARRVIGQGVIGISTHSHHEALAAAEAGADYIGFGPIFTTKTKDAGIPKGTDMLAEIRRLVSVPIIGIGGISAETCGSVVQAGAAGVAVASALSDGPVRETVTCFLSALRGVPLLTFV